jgi:hypothetical protein
MGVDHTHLREAIASTPAMLVVAVAPPLGSARSWCATMHSAAASSSHGGRPAWRSRAGPGATLGRQAQLFWLLSRVHGVVRYFSPSAPALLLVRRA